ncbi:MAG: nucleotidyltransferase family protein [Holosporales bacterium]
MIALTPHERDIVITILRAYAPNRSVMVFGSRANGTARPTSDLDLCLMGEEQAPASVLLNLKEAFDDAPLAFKVDIAEWATLPESMREEVAKAQPL